MRSRERVQRAFHFNRPDRVPRTCFGIKTDFFPLFTYVPKTFQPTNYPPHMGIIGGIQQNWLLNLITRYKWKKEPRKKLGFPRKWWNHETDGHILAIDEWGVIWRCGAVSRDFTMGHPYKGPFSESWDELGDYKTPDPLDKSRYRMWNSVIRIVSKHKYLLGAHPSVGIHNQASNLRGFLELMVDFVKNPKQCHQLIGIITEYFYKSIQKLKEVCPELDAIYILDDLGSQKNSFLSPAMFRKFFFTPYKKLVDLTHDLGMDFILHSCGQVKKLLPVFYDMGIDAIEFDSPNMTGVENFKHYAEQQKMAFWLSSNIQTTYSLGSPEDVENEIKYFIKEVGNNEGGLGFAKYMDLKVLQAPKANSKMFDRAIKKWGRYNNQGVIDWLV